MFTDKFNDVLSLQNLKNVDNVSIFLLMNSFYSCFCKATFSISNTSPTPTFYDLSPFFGISPHFKEIFAIGIETIEKYLIDFS